MDLEPVNPPKGATLLAALMVLSVCPSVDGYSFQQGWPSTMVVSWCPLSWVSFVDGKTICSLRHWLELCHRSTFCPPALLYLVSDEDLGRKCLPGELPVTLASPGWAHPPLGRKREYRIPRHSWASFLPFYQLSAWLPSGLGYHSLATEQCLCLHDVLWLRGGKLITTSQIAKQTNKSPSF